MTYKSFSKRTEWNTEETELTQTLRQRQAAGLPIADLTASNPTRCGFNYPPDLLAPLTDRAALDYDPDPRGSLRARQAICRYYLDHGVLTEPEQVLLTTSTSEAYGYLFKLLCDPGDSVLTLNPSYPLFDFLARAEAVEMISAPLLYDHGWQIDLEGLRQAILPTTRAIVLVHPNNPTGHFTKIEEANGLAAICREHGLALIVDEVFLDYGVPTEGDDAADQGSFAALNLDVLVFIVSGISKICGLPQMKVAWLAAFGPGSQEALERLEIVSDTYLSMNTPIQRALPMWLTARAGIQTQIRDRVQANLAELDSALAVPAGADRWVNRLKVEGGWYAILRIPALRPDEITSRELLDLGVLVHAGYFFGMGASGWLVVSLLTGTEEFQSGIVTLLRYVTLNQESNQTARNFNASV